MIYQGTLLPIIDNSGARLASCIKVLNQRPLSRAHLGNNVVVAIKVATPHKKVGKSQIQRALVVRDSKQKYRKEGSYIKFERGAGVIVRKDGQPLAKRILGPVSKELRNMGHVKIISLATLAL